MNNENNTVDTLNNKKIKKNFEINIDKMGLDIDKNEYREIVLSNSNHPEDIYRDY